MTAPDVQRFGSAVLLQGAAVPEISYLVGLGLRHRAAVDGAPPSVRQRQLLRILADAAEASLALPPTPGGHADTIATPHLGESVGGVGTADAATVLGVSPGTFAASHAASTVDGQTARGHSTAAPLLRTEHYERKRKPKMMDEKATAELVEQYLAGLSDSELLELLNGELARRTTVDPEEQAAAAKAKADDAEFAKFYPASKR